MNDAQKILGREEGIDLIKESDVIWENLVPNQVLLKADVGVR